MLFSEPKIPQSCRACGRDVHRCSFSALQRAENSSILLSHCGLSSRRGFQCSSASRKFLNGDAVQSSAALDRFQCSSASRKFLNWVNSLVEIWNGWSFSALQRAENSSILFLTLLPTLIECFSALQRAENSSMQLLDDYVRYRSCFSALQRAENSSIMASVGEPI